MGQLQMQTWSDWKSFTFAFGMSSFLGVSGKSMRESATADRSMPCNCRLSLWGLRAHYKHVTTATTANGFDVSRICTTAFVPSPCCTSTYKERKKMYDGLRLLYTSMMGHGTRHSSSLHMATNYDGTNDIENDDAIANNGDPIRRRNNDEWIDGQQMMQILARENAEEQRRKKEEVCVRRNSFQTSEHTQPVFKFGYR
mmetsp:Transcript_17781/g.38403  ORF Transcript_17781/g.38403 Transcript_17781/m.38403 type:complete len:198 (-) Transcript_17781:2083-2676(-)